AFKNQSCSGRNNTDPVGVTWPRGGTQKSRVGQEQYPRTTGQIAIWASGGSESESERPPAAPRSIAFARQWRARRKGGSGQTKGHGSCRSAPEIASAPAASELPIGGSRRVDRGPTDLGPIYMARKRAADISIRVCVSRGTTVVQEDELVASSLALNTWFCSTGCQYCRYSEESS
ncbi:hypothetical protein T05_7400, partial [Trichinella murrelli]